MLRVGIKFRSRGEHDPGVIGGEIKVRACPNLQVADDRNRTETRAVTSKDPIRVALKGTNMLLTAEDAFEVTAKEEDGMRAKDHVTSVELIPSVFLFRVSRSPSNI